LLQQETQR